MSTTETTAQLLNRRDAITSRIATYRQPGQPIRPEDREELEEVMAEIHRRETEAATQTPILGAHQHEIEHWPTCANGYGVCDCGATIRVEGGKPIGGWHTCPLCTPRFYDAPAVLQAIDGEYHNKELALYGLPQDSEIGPYRNPDACRFCGEGPPHEARRLLPSHSAACTELWVRETMAATLDELRYWIGKGQAGSAGRQARILYRYGRKLVEREARP